MKKIVKLPARLKAIADLTDTVPCVADIGTDHGLLPVYLAQTGIASRIFAVDISNGSLAAARRNADKYNVSDTVILINADGLVFPGSLEVNTIIIAGVGGETILKILADAAWTVSACAEGRLRLILQPQTKLDVLTNFLQNTGYTIAQKETVTDRGRIYTILVI